MTRKLDLEQALPEICAAVQGLPPKDGRTMVALAGPPASGKTTLAQSVAEELTAGGTPAAFVPMDGFHMDDRVLIARNRREQKGAPDTFDAHGFIHAIKRLKTGEQVVLPTFDRDREIAIAGAIVVEPDQKVIVAEGNFLCFQQEPWTALMPLWDLSVFLDLSRETLRERLVQRWLEHGYAQKDAEHRADSHDIPNGEVVKKFQAPTDIVLSER